MNGFTQLEQVASIVLLCTGSYRLTSLVMNYPNPLMMIMMMMTMAEAIGSDGKHVKLVLIVRAIALGLSVRTP